MRDESIAAHVERLVSEEHDLRDAGSDPKQASVRDADTVEHYQQ